MCLFLAFFHFSLLLRICVFFYPNLESFCADDSTFFSYYVLGILKVHVVFCIKLITFWALSYILIFCNHI